MKKILVLDCSLDQAFLGVFECSKKEVRVLCSLTCGALQSHNESVLEGLDSLLSKAALKLSQIDLFASGIGPGSFTGIRIACSTIKGFAQVYDKKVIGFSSLQALGYSNVDSNISSQEITAHRNAYQSMVFEGSMVNAVWTDRVISSLEAEKKLNITTGAITETGMLRLFKEKIASTDLFLDGEELIALQANYIRPSQAEINLQKLK